MVTVGKERLRKERLKSAMNGVYHLFSEVHNRSHRSLFMSFGKLWLKLADRTGRSRFATVRSPPQQPPFGLNRNAGSCSLSCRGSRRKPSGHIRSVGRGNHATDHTAAHLSVAADAACALGF